MKYIWFYKVFILIVKSFIPTIIKVAHHFEKVQVCLKDKNHIHDWVYFEYTVTKNMEICDLNSYPHDLFNILFK